MDQQKLGQLIVTGVPGAVLDPETAAVFRRIQPGGYILFARNIKSPRQLRKLIDDLRDLSEIQPIITIDQEGGRVSRLREIGNEPPNAFQLRKKGDRELIARHGHITGRLLRLFGFNLDLCPVLDISFDDDADNSLRGRCYGTSVEEVIDLAGAFNDGMRAEGICSCGKHFPGYSRAGLDPHHELAVFRRFIPNVDSIMIGHAYYPSLDPEQTPTSLSKEIVQRLLREELGFRGLIMTDDLDMGAILNHYSLEDTIRLAIEAGNDLALICHRIPSIAQAFEVIEKLPSKILDRAMANIAAFKATMVAPDPFSEDAFERLNSEVWDLRVATLGEQKALDRSPEDGKRSPVELY